MYTVTYNLSPHYQDYLRDKDEEYIGTLHKVSVEHMLEAIMKMPTEATQNRSLLSKMENLITEKMGNMQNMLGTKVETLSNYIAIQSKMDLQQLSNQAKERQLQDEELKTQLNRENELLRQRNMELEKRVILVQHSAPEKGEFGEVLLEQFLTGEYPEQEIVRTGGNGKKDEGDLQMRGLDQSGSFITIEVKNALKVSHKDNTKSIGHAKLMKAKYGAAYVGHMFVSLETSKVYKGRSLEIDVSTLGNSMLVFVGIDGITEENKKILRMAFDIIVKYVPIYKRIQEVTSADNGELETIQAKLLEFARRWKFRNEKITEIQVQLEQLRKVSSTISSNLNMGLASFFSDYQEMCMILGAEPVEYNMSPEMEEVVREGIQGMSGEVSSTHKQCKKKEKVGKQKKSKFKGDSVEDMSNVEAPKSINDQSWPLMTSTGEKLNINVTKRPQGRQLQFAK
jgi:hypothetical protein